MKCLLLRGRFLEMCGVLICTMLGALESRAAEKEPVPVVGELIRAAQQTLAKLQGTPASWRVRYRAPNGFTMETKVVQDKERRSWTFAHEVNGRARVVSRVVERDGIWHVFEGGRRTKYRPYEAELTLPWGYLLLELAELRCVVDNEQLAAAKFEGRRGRIVSYRIPLPPENRALIEKSVAGLEQLRKQDPAYVEKPETTRTLQLMREQLAKGTPLTVDETTGLLVECKLRDLLISFEDFRWLKDAPDADFALPSNAKWDDQTRPWSEAELNDCVMVGHDPLFQAGGKSPSIDAYLLNVRSGRVRRLPYQGISSMGGCFLKDRREVIVSGYDVDGPVGLVKVNLETGVNTLIDSDLSKGRISLFAELSPDKNKVATIQISANGQATDLQIRVVDLGDGDSRLLGPPKAIGGPFSWLPDGDGIILKRFERMADPRAIEPRILCRMDLDGKLTDLRAGDWPVVLRKTRKILFKDDKSRRWHTCELDGTKPQLFADGLEMHGTPAVSPDETKVIFARYEEGKLPELVLFEVGSMNGKPVVKASGFTGTPIWR